MMTACFISLKSSFSKSSFVIKQAISFSTATTLTLSTSNFLKILEINGAAILDVIIVASPVTGLMNCKNTSFSSLAIANGPPVTGSHRGVPLTLNLYSLLICFTSSENSSTGWDSIPLIMGSFPKINPYLQISSKASLLLPILLKNCRSALKHLHH